MEICESRFLKNLDFSREIRIFLKSFFLYPTHGKYSVFNILIQQKYQIS